jgi:hypothetical protein
VNGVRVAALALGAAALLAPGRVAFAQASVGCHADWPVLVHYSDGTPARARPPVPCGVATGYASSESTIAVTNKGTIFYSPANSENSLARSVDGGATWTLDYPPKEQYTSLWNTVDPAVVVDRRTGRLLWVHTTFTTDVRPPIEVPLSPIGWLAPTAIANAHGFQVYSSPDGGASWKTADYQHEFTADWEKIFVGPPAAGAPQPAGYPDVVYVCANAPLEISGPGRACYRSRDGGVTFSFASYVFPSASAPAAICPALAADTGVVAADGTTYQPQSCSNGSYVVVSHDEGATYSWLPLTGAPAANSLGSVVQLAIDNAGDLYALWEANGQLELAISRDGARSWSAPLAVAAPGVGNVTLPALAAGPRGYVGVVYYATATAGAQQLSAYITETRDALDARPLFYSAAVNDPAHPIFTNYGYETTPRADFVGATYDAGGVLWAGVVKQLGAPDAEGRVTTTGYVGRLAF